MDRSDAIVPIVSLESMFSDDSLERLPSIVNKCHSTANVVIGTKRDLVQEDNLQERESAIKKAFQREKGAIEVLSCSTRLALSARALLALSENEKPKFEEFWGGDKIEHYVRSNLIGPLVSLSFYRLPKRFWEITRKQRLKDAIRKKTTKSG